MTTELLGAGAVAVLDGLADRSEEIGTGVKREKHAGATVHPQRGLIPAPWAFDETHDDIGRIAFGVDSADTPLSSPVLFCHAQQNGSLPASKINILTQSGCICRFACCTAASPPADAAAHHAW